jgi:hypothetical protein
VLRFLGFFNYGNADLSPLSLGFVCFQIYRPQGIFCVCLYPGFPPSTVFASEGYLRSLHSGFPSSTVFASEGYFAFACIRAFS